MSASVSVLLQEAVVEAVHSQPVLWLHLVSVSLSLPPGEEVEAVAVAAVEVLYRVLLVVYRRPSSTHRLP